ncbi:MAG: DUF2848 domain-containing protein [Pseudomonadota bacterium]
MLFSTPEGLIDLAIRNLTVAGWTGRDRAAVDHHIAELAALGVAPPSKVPLYYRVSDALLTQAASIQVVGAETSGEVEPLVIRSGGRLYLGLASDHTDRALEVASVAASKQVCDKPVAGALWPWEEVENHLDALKLRTEIEEEGVWVPYQEGTLAAIRPLPDLIADAALADGDAMLCGTLSTIDGVRPARAYRMALTDPVLGRDMSLAYTVMPLPIVA